MSPTLPAMSAPGHCPLCGGRLRLLHHGAAEAPDPSALAPSCHQPGAYGDLFRCADCHAVHQPSLPGGASLQDLYRGMADEAYLDEEAGRRATANRLLDLIEPGRATGRLLDVGCGHGLLLDEARKRGYDAAGLELSAGNAAYAREKLGLSVREVPLEELGPEEDGRWDVVVLADVIEHLGDPVGALERCQALLAPGGALLVVTPDPSSTAARLAGPRWWGYLPAHTILLPRALLRELMAARGLVIARDVAFVRTFSLGYWVSGLAERSPRLAALRRGAKALGRQVSLSLGDERVIVARKVPVREPERPLFADRGGDVKVHIVLPAYGAEKTVAQVATELPEDAADRALLVDDASPDETTTVALREGFDVIRHPVNRGYGANQMTCYQRSLLDGADVVVMVHADNQYDPGLIPEMVAPIVEGRADVVLGSRLLHDRAIMGGMPRWKWVGNRFLTGIENRAFRRSFSEYHTGYRAFSAEFLRSIAFLRNSDAFVFDQEIFAQAVAAGARVEEVPIPTRYFREASSVSFFKSVDYGLRTLAVLARYRRDEKRRDWSLLRPPSTVARVAGAGTTSSPGSGDEATVAEPARTAK
jgi:SAM-dependent methyltransferase